MAKSWTIYVTLWKTQSDDEERKRRLRNNANKRRRRRWAVEWEGGRPVDD